jgi:O-antigen/teichoic acid export membrane protein
VSQSEEFHRFSGTDNVRENLSRKSVHGAFFIAAGSAGDFVLRLGATAFLARLVIPEYWGLIGMVFAFTTIAESIQDMGLSVATIQSKEITHDQVTNLFWVNVLAGALISLVISALSPAISAFYKDPRLIPISIAISTNFFLTGLGVQHQALLVRQMKLPQIAIINVGATALSNVFAIILAVNHYGYWALAWREPARHVFVVIGMYSFCPWVPGLPKRGTDVGALLWFGIHMTMTHVVSGIVWSLDKILVGKFCGPAALGMYRQGYQLIMSPMDYLYAPIGRVAEPALSALQVDPDRYRRYYKRIVFFLSFISLPLGLFIAVYAREITLFVLGEKWVDAAVILRIFALVACLRPLSTSISLVQITCGRSKAYFYINVMRSVVLVLLMLVGLQWGAVGVAAAFLAEMLLTLWPTLHYSFRNTPVAMSSFLTAIVRPLMASLGMTLALVLLRPVLPVHVAFVALVLGGAIAAAVYLGVWIVLPGGTHELRELVSDLRAELRKRARPSTTPAVVTDSVL